MKPAALTALRLAERGLLWAALGLFCVYGFFRGQAWVFEWSEGRRLSALSHRTTASSVANLAAGSAVPRPTFSSEARRAAEPGRAFGRIELRRLNLSALVAEGTDASTLNVAVGHWRGSAFPGESGNVALAGHRDTFFRGLAQARAGDVVRLETPDGTFSYRIEELFVVSPDRVDVLEAQGDATLTLVTCYPFSYVGAAPSRFIVRARLLPAENEPARALSTKDDVRNGSRQGRRASNSPAGLRT